MKTSELNLNRATTFFQLTKRHLLVFFRNKVRVFFTLMVPFIIFAVYILFLRDLQLNTANTVLIKVGEELNTSFTGDLTLKKHVAAVIDSWMLSGIIAISTITVSFQTNTIIVSDRENGINRDFASSPISRTVLIASYFLFNVIVTILICFVFLLVCLIYLLCMGEFAITFLDFIVVCATLIFASVISVLLTVFICSFISRDSTMASVNTIFSAAVGFLVGAYLPLATMPHWAQNICIFFPGTLSCSLLRYSFMSTPVNNLTAYVSSLNVEGSADIINGITKSFGYDLTFFGVNVAPGWQAFANCIIMAILLALNVLSVNKMVSVIGEMGKKIAKKSK